MKIDAPTSDLHPPHLKSDHYPPIGQSFSKTDLSRSKYGNFCTLLPMSLPYLTIVLKLPSLRFKSFKDFKTRDFRFKPSFPTNSDFAPMSEAFLPTSPISDCPQTQGGNGLYQAQVPRGAYGRRELGRM